MSKYNNDLCNFQRIWVNEVQIAYRIYCKVINQLWQEVCVNRFEMYADCYKYIMNDHDMKTHVANFDDDSIETSMSRIICSSNQNTRMSIDFFIVLRVVYLANFNLYHWHQQIIMMIFSTICKLNSQQHRAHDLLNNENVITYFKKSFENMRIEMFMSQNHMIVKTQWNSQFELQRHWRIETFDDLFITLRSNKLKYFCHILLHEFSCEVICINCVIINDYFMLLYSLSYVWEHNVNKCCVARTQHWANDDRFEIFENQIWEQLRQIHIWSSRRYVFFLELSKRVNKIYYVMSLNYYHDRDSLHIKNYIFITLRSFFTRIIAWDSF